MNTAGLGTQALPCGGLSTEGGVGTCAAVCTNILIGRPSIPPLACATNGGDEAIAGDGTGYSTIFLYPLANSPQNPAPLCKGPDTLTWAECCSDRNLVIVVTLHNVYSSDKSKLTSMFTDQSEAGFLNAQAQ
jgi:hypothetical protein